VAFDFVVVLERWVEGGTWRSRTGASLKPRFGTVDFAGNYFAFPSVPAEVDKASTVHPFEGSDLHHWQSQEYLG